MHLLENRTMHRPLILSIVAHVGICTALLVTQSSATSTDPRKPARITIMSQRTSSAASATCECPPALAEPVAPMPLVDLPQRATSQHPVPQPEPLRPARTDRPERNLPKQTWAKARVLAKRSVRTKGARRESEPLPTPTFRPIPAAVSASAAQVAPGAEPRQPQAQVLTPVPGTNHPPSYPRIARRRGYEGTVRLRVSCDLLGRVTTVSVTQSSGHRCLDDAAASAVRRWRFKNGPGVIDQPFAFELAQ